MLILTTRRKINISEIFQTNQQYSHEARTHILEFSPRLETVLANG
jgi:hypothetical protein